MKLMPLAVAASLSLGCATAHDPVRWNVTLATPAAESAPFLVCARKPRHEILCVDLQEFLAASADREARDENAKAPPVDL